MRASPKMTAKGFTLIELMTTLAIIGIIATAAAPSYRSFIANQHARGDAQELFGSLIYARSEALKRNASVFITANGGTWSDGFVISTSSMKTVADCLADATDAECLAVRQEFKGTVVNTTAHTQIEYSNTGRSGAVSTFTVCDEFNNARKRVIKLSLTGRPNLSVEGEGSCAP